LKVRRIAPKNEGKKLKVATYCRVSTDKSSQEESLETQQRTYETMIRCNPSWEYAGIYVDEGRSGVTDKREGFQQMIADAKAGRINKILVKSISRFGRDILLCRQYVEELAAHNVSVYFEREGIDSLNPGTLMLLSLSAHHCSG
jgi:DNA invertase Pin-like site-specific DNA recombinase